MCQWIMFIYTWDKLLKKNQLPNTGIFISVMIYSMRKIKHNHPVKCFLTTRNRDCIDQVWNDNWLINDNVLNDHCYDFKDQYCIYSEKFLSINFEFNIWIKLNEICIDRKIMLWKGMCCICCKITKQLIHEMFNKARWHYGCCFSCQYYSNASYLFIGKQLT